MIHGASPSPPPLRAPDRQAALGRYLRRNLPLVCLVLLSSALAGPTGQVTWDAFESKLSADLKHEPLRHSLQLLSAQTGWEIMVDPGLDLPVSTRFRNLNVADGLRRLLGELNFSLRPRPYRSPRLFVYQNAPQDATLLIPRSPDDAEPSTNRIGNELIIRLDPDAAITIDELARQYGAKVVGKVGDLNAYRLEFPSESSAQEAREAILADHAAGSLEDNFTIHPPHTAQTPTLSRSSLPLKPKVVPSDEQVVVALLDTAIATDSPALLDLMLPAIRPEGAQDTPVETSSLTHGTAMAQTLYQSLAAASQDPDGTPVRILPVDIYGDQPSTTTFDVVDGLFAAAQQGADVINLSLGGADPSPLLQEAIHSLRQQGTLVIAAAGNQPTMAEVFPAAYPDVLAVTAVDPHGNLAPYANRGEFIDLFGPGTSLLYHDDQAYLGNGTSYASAHISGAAAAFLATPNASPEAVADFLRQVYAYEPPAP